MAALIKIFLLTLLGVLHSGVSRRVKAGGKTCEFEGQDICNGAVVEEKLFTAKVCDNGKIKTKGLESVKANPRLGKNTGPGKGIEGA